MGKKYFVAYRFTGEDPIELEARMNTLIGTLKEAGFNPSCNLWEPYTQPEAGLTPGEIIKEGFKELDSCDGLFALIAGSEKSEGMLMEIGYAYAKGKKVIVAKRAGVSTYADQMADQIIEWQDYDDLTQKVATLVVHD